MASTSDLRNGLVIMHNGEICTVLGVMHRTPGKGKAFYQVELRKIRDGKLLEHRFRSGESIETIRVDRKEMQYLYRDATALIFMDTETYEQIPVQEELVGTGAGFLKESGEASVSFVDGEIIEVELPPHVTLEVTETEPGFKGDTSSNVQKPAKCATGLQVQVPLFVEVGNKLKIDTRTGSYVERVKV